MIKLDHKWRKVLSISIYARRRKDGSALFMLKSALFTYRSVAPADLYDLLNAMSGAIQAFLLRGKCACGGDLPLRGQTQCAACIDRAEGR